MDLYEIVEYEAVGLCWKMTKRTLKTAKCLEYGHFLRAKKLSTELYITSRKKQQFLTRKLFYNFF